MGGVHVDISRRPGETVSYAKCGGKVWRSFLARKGERCMKDRVHAAVHRSVHLFGEGKFYGALRLRFTRPLILDTGKTPEWAGATPLRCHGKRGGRSSPQVEPGIRSRRVLLGRAARFRREQMKKVRI